MRHSFFFPIVVNGLLAEILGFDDIVMCESRQQQ